MPGLVQRYLDGTLKIDEFITFTFPLEQINEAFDAMHDGKRFEIHTFLFPLILTILYFPFIPASDLSSTFERTTFKGL